jgi:outer membrane protein W
LENTEGATKNGQSRETDNIGYTRRRQIKQKHNTICVRHHYAQANNIRPWLGTGISKEMVGWISIKSIQISSQLLSWTSTQAVLIDLPALLLIAHKVVY